MASRTQRKKRRLSRMKVLPAGCGYMGRDFGASYIDSECFGGQLYDLDRCHEPGTLLEPDGYFPCPQCNHEAWLLVQIEDVFDDGWCARDDGKPRQHPIVESRLRYPEDFERLVAAWQSGWDSHNE